MFTSVSWAKMPPPLLPGSVHKYSLIRRNINLQCNSAKINTFCPTKLKTSEYFRNHQKKNRTSCVLDEYLLKKYYNTGKECMVGSCLVEVDPVPSPPYPRGLRLSVLRYRWLPLLYFNFFTV